MKCPFTVAHIADIAQQIRTGMTGTGRIADLVARDIQMTELDKLRNLLSDAAAGFEALGVHSPGCGYYEDPAGPPVPCDCGLERLRLACELASKADA